MGEKLGALAMATHSRLGERVPHWLAESLFHSGLLQNMDTFRGLYQLELTDENSGPYAALFRRSQRRRIAGDPWMRPSPIP